MKPPLLAALPATATAPRDPAASPVPSPAQHRRYRTVRLGLCEDYPEESHSLVHATEDLRALSAAGCGLLKISVPWLDIEPERGRYHWSHLDGFIELAEAAGVTLLPYICYAPRWATGDRGPGSWRYPPQDVADFRRFMRDLAARYRGRVPSWEIWSEPDNAEFYCGTQADYAALVKAGSEGVRAGDPDAKVVFGGIAWNAWWLNGLFRDHGVSPYVDAVNLHNYYETWNDQPIEEITRYIGRVADTVARYGDGQPLWMAEVGYSTYRDGARVSASVNAYFDYEHTPRYQAEHLVRAMTLMLSTEQMDTIAWYEVRNLPLTLKVIGDVNNNYLGINGSDLDEMPAMRAFGFINGLFGDAHRCIDAELRVTRPVASDAHAHAFELTDGRVVVVAWLQTFFAGRRSAPEWGGVADTRQETIDLSLPLTGAHRASTFDATGTLRQSATLSPVDGQAALRLLLCGGETAVLVLEPAAAAVLSEAEPAGA